MRCRTAMLLVSAVTVTTSAAIGAAVATLLAADADARVDRGYQAIAGLLAARPPLDEDRPPRLTVVRE